VSVDVDSTDLWLTRALLTGGYRPRVLSNEFNINWNATQSISVERKWAPWPGTSVYGASAAALNHVIAPYGYRAVHIMPEGLDMFFVREDELERAGCTRDELPSFAYAAARAKLGRRVHRSCAPADAARLLDVPLALAGRLEDAHAAAMEAVKFSNGKHRHNPVCAEQGPRSHTARQGGGQAPG